MQQPDSNIRLTGDEAAAEKGALDFPHTRPSDVIEAGIDAVGGVLNWIWLVLVIVIVGNVVGRYVFAVNYIWIEEMQWHMYAVGFMLGIGYTLRHDGHVRVDVLAMNMRPRTRAWVELLGLVFLLAPVIYVILLNAVPFVEASWRRGETSSAPGGLSNRWAIKGVIVLAFVYLALAVLARFLRICAFLFGYPRPRPAA